MADHTQRIAEIDAVLQAGAAKVNVDGQVVEFDFDALRAERRRLVEENTSTRGTRPVVSSVRLGGF